MGFNIADQYYLKARGAMSGFCSDWEEVCEGLNYALSHDENHLPSLLLLGKIHANFLSDFEAAFSCYDKIIAINPNYTEVYPKYILTLIWADQLGKAQKLIDFALTIKGVSEAEIYSTQSYIYEVHGDYKEGIKYIKKARKLTYNDYYRDFLNDEKKRLKEKIEESKPKKKTPKNKKKKGKKTTNKKKK